MPRKVVADPLHDVSPVGRVLREPLRAPDAGLLAGRVAAPLRSATCTSTARSAGAEPARPRVHVAGERVHVEDVGQRGLASRRVRELAP
jgi:hypothetical protein